MLLRSLLTMLREGGGSYAFCIDDRHYTYEQLYNAVNTIKARIENVRRNASRKNIAVVCSDDFYTYSSLLAIWFSGSAYVPLGLHNPAERNLSILKDADIELIISTIPLDDKIYSGYVVVDPSLEDISKSELMLPDLDDQSLAYILFTSGSTGLPKGVPITFKSLDSFINNFNSTPFKIGSADRCLQMFELTFDVSISSFLIPLLAGACVYTIPNNAIKYVHVLKLLQTYKLTSIQIVPSVIRLARPLLKRLVFPEVRNCILTGEATYAELLHEWRKCVPNARIFDFYGPTEATIYCSFNECSGDVPKEYNGMLAIGKPLGDMQLVIVDDQFKEIPCNQKGELLIAGPQLTEGYVNNPVKNKEAFIQLAFDGGLRTYYRSGDSCYKDENGDIFYCGRLDNQVKVQGFRVELSEIEVVVRNKFNIGNVVVPVEFRPGIVELVLVIEKGPADIGESITAFLKTKLPAYMLPGKVMQIESFPLGSSGKTDKKKIKELIVNGL